MTAIRSLFDPSRDINRSIEKVITYQALRWSPKTGQVAKRESPLGTAGWPEVRHGKYTEEAQS
jgi:hypothetical protein